MAKSTVTDAIERISHRKCIPWDQREFHIELQNRLQVMVNGLDRIADEGTHKKLKAMLEGAIALLEE